MKYITALLAAIAYLFVTVTSAEALQPKESHGLGRHHLRYRIPPPGRHGGHWMGGLGPPSKDEPKRHHS
uniref:Uncharacterized protein n=1 Tax=Anopheles funestus TaxID=62324 RepID=A0A182R599_ANOFN